MSLGWANFGQAHFFWNIAGSLGYVLDENVIQVEKELRAAESLRSILWWHMCVTQVLHKGDSQGWSKWWSTKTLPHSRQSLPAYSLLQVGSMTFTSWSNVQHRIFGYATSSSIHPGKLAPHQVKFWTSLAFRLASLLVLKKIHLSEKALMISYFGWKRWKQRPGRPVWHFSGFDKDCKTFLQFQ